ncbi:MAG: hypothetical protein QME64_03335, partial [bacterium]|nr:hypothetical protein [bacterium]
MAWIVRIMSYWFRISNGIHNKAYIISLDSKDIKKCYSNTNAKSFSQSPLRISLRSQRIVFHSVLCGSSWRALRESWFQYPHQNYPLNPSGGLIPFILNMRRLRHIGNTFGIIDSAV